ncbi:hypothetical protein PHLCEN_2v3291 [Hermanssonia centrifuga]|uniref:Uncharacterized protein n=1 Tax=Hermanssonia centrifuga TaxID=98765 RepID=A0A2R6QQF4_9APHY|nr:hypothetical protein PHLCEN_2v3296 [Hermanssonia centrifuga]PSS12760.1 hypothetical protein PHLCEN_2v3291 [Hermanssonia centrifuga]
MAPEASPLDVSQIPTVPNTEPAINFLPSGENVRHTTSSSESGPKMDSAMVQFLPLSTSHTPMIVPFFRA